MCYTTIYVYAASCCYTYSILILLYMCPHICVIRRYVLYSHAAVHIASSYYTCVLILLYLCPHTTVFVSSGEYNGAIAQFRLVRDKEKIRYELMCVLTLLYYVCDLILPYMCPHATICVPRYEFTCQRAGGAGAMRECEQLSTKPGAGVEGGHLREYLAQLDAVACPPNKLLQQRCNDKGIKDNVEVLCQTAGEKCCEKWKMRCVTPSSGDVFGTRHVSFLHQCRDATTRSLGFLFVAGTSLCASFWEVVSHCWHTQSSCDRLASE